MIYEVLITTGLINSDGLIIANQPDTLQKMNKK